MRARVALVLAAALLLTCASYLIQRAVYLSSSSRKPCLPRGSMAAVTPPLTQPPPVAARREQQPGAPASNAGSSSSNPNERLSEPYTWLRDDSRSSPEVLDYLKAENRYAAAQLSRLQPLVDELLADMDRVPDTEVTAPRLVHGHVYYESRGVGHEYFGTHRVALPGPGSDSSASLADVVAAAVRRSATGNSTDAASQLVLDQNALSAGHTYWDVVGKAISPDGRGVAFLYDTVGEEDFTLQVLDVASGQPLLPEAVSGCGETVVWLDNITLAFTWRDDSVPDRSRMVVRMLQLQPPAAAPAAAAGAAGSSSRQGLWQGLLYAPQQDERGLDLSLSTDRQFVLISSSIGGESRVVALPAATALASAQQQQQDAPSSDSAGGSSRALPLAVPASAWWLLVAPEDDLDVLSCNHVGSSSAADAAVSRFVAIVDSDAAADGELLLITAAAPSQDLKARHEVLVSNRGHYSFHGSSSSSSDADSDASPSSSSSSSSSDSHRQQQHGGAGTEGVAVEVRSFELHPSGSHVAVAVRRQGVCAVDVYAMPTAAGSGAAANDGSHSNVPVVVLQTATSASDGSQQGCAAASDGADANATAASAVEAARLAAATAVAANASTSSARLVWSLVLQDPTLVLDLQAVATREDATTTPGGSGVPPPASSSSLADSWLVIQVSSIVTPTSLWYVNLADPKTQVKVYEESLPRFNAACYTSQMDWAVSADSVQVPITVALRRDTFKGDGSNRAILHAYGAYGASQWPSFNPADLALLDRGVVLAVAHVRGGGELGSAWHTAAQKRHKRRTFEDLIAAASHLVAARYTRSEALGLWGRSAGGLTMAAALNMAGPGLAGAAVLDVPFLDVLGDMSDPDLPLTIKERREWGDPLASEAARNYISSYSPLHNLNPARASDLPAMLLTASLHDTRVNFWEPAKYVATLRDLQHRSGRRPAPLLLLTDLGHAGHFAASAASTRLQERAEKVAFLLSNLQGGGGEGC